MNRKHLNREAIDEAHYILAEAYTELESIPEAILGLSRALDLIRHREAVHKPDCEACSKGYVCPEVGTLRETASRLTLALEIISRYAELQLEYIRNATGVIGQELYRGDERTLTEEEKPRLTVLSGKSREKTEEGESEPAS